MPRDYLSDTPLLRTMGFLVSQHGQLGAIPPPPFLSVSPLESMRSGGAIPSPRCEVIIWAKFGQFESHYLGLFFFTILPKIEAVKIKCFWHYPGHLG